LFSESGYEVVFIDVNTEIIKALNSIAGTRSGYWVMVVQRIYGWKTNISIGPSEALKAICMISDENPLFGLVLKYYNELDYTLSDSCNNLAG